MIADAPDGATSPNTMKGGGAAARLPPAQANQAPAT